MEPVAQIKTQIDEIGHAFAEFQHTFDKNQKDKDGYLEGKLKGLAETITINHEAVTRELELVKAASERLAKLETALDRLPLPAAPSEKQEDDRQLFQKMRWTFQAHNSGAPPETTHQEIVDYTKAFRSYMRRGGNNTLSMMLPEECKALSIGSDPDGGYWALPPSISQRVITRIFETSPVRQVATVETIGAPSLKIPEDPNDITVSKVSELGARTATATPAIAMKEIFAHEKYAMPKASQQSLEDGMIDFEAWLARKVGDKFSRAEATDFVLGTGVGEARGFTTYPSGTSWNQIEQINSGTAADFKYDGLVKLIVGIKDIYQRDAVWMMRRASVGNIMLLVDGSSRLIFQPIVNGNFNDTPLLGYRIKYASDMAAVAANALAAAFGDFGQGYTIVDRVGLSTIRDNVTDKPHVLFYTRRRVGGDVVDFDAIKLQKLAA